MQMAPIAAEREAELRRLGDEIAELSAHIVAATARLLDLIREFDERGGWSGSRSCAEWLSWRASISPGAAREKVRVARTLGTLPQIAGALARGEVSYSKVRAITRVATPETEERLLAMARAGTAAHVERLVRGWRCVDRKAEATESAARHRSRSLHVYQDDDGMVVVRGRLTAEAGAVLIRALDAARETLYQQARDEDPFKTRTHPVADPPTMGQQQADALALLAETALHHELDPGAPGERYQVVVHVDAAVLADPDQAGQSVLEDGVRVPAETSQRLACDASRVVMRHDDEGRVVEVGARTRTIPSALRRALHHRDRGCRFPGCGLRFGQGHHIRHWAAGGPTTISNLTMLCRRHHRAVHEEGYAVERRSDARCCSAPRRATRCRTCHVPLCCRPTRSKTSEPRTRRGESRSTGARACRAGSTWAMRSTSCIRSPEGPCYTRANECPAVGASMKKKRPAARASREAAPRVAESYAHYDATSPMRPEVGTQPQFRKKKPPQTYRYDSSLAPALAWDGQNAARELGEWLLAMIEQAAALPAPHVFAEPREFKGADGRVVATVRNLQEAVEQLKRLGRPLLDWAGKAERTSFDVPTLPLFVHERLSTKAIVETLVGHRRDKQQDMFELFGDPRHSVTDQVLKAYEYQDKWVNRLILGDSLVVMNSLLHYEGLGGQVQMIYMDPPYGVRFGSNFQPFVRRRDVSHNDDADMTREPEMVKAYRDTWELGLHSYLAYLRDRLLLSRELLKPSGSIFVQISDENLHHVRELLDEIFGAENLVAIIPFRKKTMPLGARHLESVTDYLLWMARDVEQMTFRSLYLPMSVEGDTHWNYVELSDGIRRKMTPDEINNHRLLPSGSTPVQLVSLYPAGVNQSGLFTFRFRGKDYRPPSGNSWFTNPEGMKRLASADRIEPYEDGETLRYVLKLSDSPVSILTNLWADTSAPADKTYAVQTSTRVVQRCMLMSTDPGDLVLDPTCGSGTTAYVAEQWGRRWITVDTSRVPLALARQRLLTATLPYYTLREDSRGPAGGFCYSRRQNRRGEEVGGIVPYVTKGSVGGEERAKEIVLFDRPDVDRDIVRVTGAFTFEATIPTPLEWETDAGGGKKELDDDHGSFVDRMLEVLRKSPVFHVGGGKTVSLKNVRPPAKTLSLSAEAMVANGSGDKAVAFLFGPENGAISQMLVHEALREAHLKGYAHLYVVGFAIQPDARVLIERSADMGMVQATYVQATPDLMMGDLLKNMRSSQIFSVCGLPEVRVRGLKAPKKGDPARYEVELVGLDVFDPTTMKADHRPGNDVPAWFLDTDYNGLCFHVSQAFFPRTGAWNDLRRALGRDYDDSVWEHLAGTTSAPFEAGEHRQVAVKVIDDRGNELLVVKSLKDSGA